MSFPRAVKTIAAVHGGLFRNDNYGDIRRILKDRLEMPETRIRWGLHPDCRACSESFNDADSADSAGIESPPAFGHRVRR